MLMRLASELNIVRKDFYTSFFYFVPLLDASCRRL
jgi:hypothetical protein